MKNKNSVKRQYFFPNEKRPRLNVTEKIEIRIFQGNDENKKRTRHPLLNVHNYLNHSFWRMS